VKANQIILSVIKRYEEQSQIYECQGFSTTKEQSAINFPPTI